MAALSLAPPQWLAVVLLLVLGAGWIIALTTLNGAAQGVLQLGARPRPGHLPDGVQRRDGGGQPAVGLVAQELGVAATLLVGGVGLLAAGCCSTACACRPARPICSRRTIGRSRWSTRRLRTIAAR